MIIQLLQMRSRIDVVELEYVLVNRRNHERKMMSLILASCFLSGRGSKQRCMKTDVP